ncbi:alpha-crystallin domain-containing protein [Thermococcus peptonophilus]
MGLRKAYFLKDSSLEGGVLVAPAAYWMPIFGKKERKKKTYAEIIRELSEKYRLPEDVIRAIGKAHLALDGLCIISEADRPENNIERVKKL